MLESAHDGIMKIETTIAIPEDLLRIVDARSSDYGGRSRLVEAAIRAFVGGASKVVARVRKRGRQAAELPIFDRCRPLTKLPSRTELYDEIYGDDESF
jgi:hypothetical protein